MSPKEEPTSLSKLKRKRGWVRYWAREAYEALKSHVEGLPSVNVGSVELWQISSLESELKDVEACCDVYADAHDAAQCVDGDEEDEDTSVVREFQCGLLSMEQDVRTFCHQFEEWFANQPPQLNQDVSDSQPRYWINKLLRPDPLPVDILLSSFHVWRQKFQDFYLLNAMDKFSICEQHAQLCGCMDVALVQTISLYLDVTNEEPVVDVLDKIQAHIAKSVDILFGEDMTSTLWSKNQVNHFVTCLLGSNLSVAWLSLKKSQTRRCLLLN